VAREIKTTFATNYSRRITLEQMLQPEVMAEYQTRRSNTKALGVPHLGRGGGGASAQLKEEKRGRKLDTGHAETLLV
jgi:hypothetical protein